MSLSAQRRDVLVGALLLVSAGIASVVHSAGPGDPAASPSAVATAVPSAAPGVATGAGAAPTSTNSTPAPAATSAAGGSAAVAINPVLIGLAVPRAEILTAQIADAERALQRLDRSDDIAAQRRGQLQELVSLLEVSQGNLLFLDALRERSGRVEHDLAQAQRDYDALKAAIPQPDLPPEAPREALRTDLASVEGALTRTETEVRYFSDRRSELLARLQALPREIEQAERKLAEASEGLATEIDTTDVATLSERILLARVTMLETTLQRLREEQRFLRDVDAPVDRRLGVAEETEDLLVERVAALRGAVTAASADTALAEHSRTTPVQTTDPSMLALSADTQRRIEELRQLGEEAHARELTRLERRRILDELRRNYANDLARFNTPGDARPRAEHLRRRKERMPDGQALANRIREREAQLDEIAVRNAEVSDEIDRLRQPDAEIDRLLGEKPALVEPQAVHAWRTQMESILATRRDQVLRPLNDALAAAADATNETLSVDRQLLDLQSQVHDLTLRVTLWGPTTRPVQLADIPLSVRELVTLVTDPRWRDLPAVVAQAMHDAPWTSVLSILWLILVTMARPRLLRIIKDASSANPRRDGFGPTVAAAGASLVLATQIWIPIHMIGDVIATSPSASRFSMAFGHALGRVARAAFLVQLMLEVCRPGGLAERHFGMMTQSVAAVRRGLRLAVLWLPLVLILRLAEEVTPRLLALERMAVLLLLLSLGAGFIIILRPMRFPVRYVDRSALSFLRSMGAQRMSYLAVCGAVGAMLLGVLVGYLDTVIFLLPMVLRTGSAIFLVVAGAGFLERLLLVRLGRARAEEAASPPKDGSSEAEIVADEALDLGELSEQARNVIRLAAVLTLTLWLSTLWRGALPAIAPIADMALWEDHVKVISGTGTGAIETVRAEPVTIADLIFCLLAIGATIYLAGNVPGAVELLVTQPLGLQSGSRYAVSQLVRYAVALAGVSWSLTLVNVGWSKLQWLAAGFSVGLGFGLQEIFGNFVSGLILLVERSIRVGDFVTVGSVAGRVRRIRMRATLIRNLDGKDILIPNKEFITAEVVNWTLEDSQVRLVLPVGVAYGSDPAEIERLLLDVAAADPEVHKDPPPTIDFVGFGDSALNFNLRVFIDEVGEGAGTRKRLNQAIYQALQRAGISIPFPQMDLHLPRGLMAQGGGPGAGQGKAPKSE